MMPHKVYSKNETKNQLTFFNISWLSSVDGPGKRVVLFLQGCNLDCIWCHSPHSKPKESPILFFESRCTLCGKCAEACENNVHRFEDGKHTLNRTFCTKCGKCVDACQLSKSGNSAGVLQLPTQTMEVGDLFELLRPQLDIIKSIGGITFSGGEPLMQSKALAILAKLCKDYGIHIAIETSGIVPTESLKEIAPYVDTWMFGMRLTTGEPEIKNELEKMTRQSLDFLTSDKKNEIIVRIPEITGHTMSGEYLQKAKSIMEEYEITEVEFLPFNPETSHYYRAMSDGV